MRLTLLWSLDAQVDPTWIRKLQETAANPDPLARFGLSVQSSLVGAERHGLATNFTAFGFPDTGGLVL